MDPNGSNPKKRPKYEESSNNSNGAPLSVMGGGMPSYTPSPNAISGTGIISIGGMSGNMTSTSSPSNATRVISAGSSNAHREDTSNRILHSISIGSGGSSGISIGAGGGPSHAPSTPSPMSISIGSGMGNAMNSGMGNAMNSGMGNVMNPGMGSGLGGMSASLQNSIGSGMGASLQNSIGSGMGGAMGAGMSLGGLGGAGLSISSMGMSGLTNPMGNSLSLSGSGLNMGNFMQHQMQQYNVYMNKVASVTATLTYASRIIGELNTLMQHLERDVATLSQLENSLRQHLPPAPSMFTSSYPNPPYPAAPLNNPAPVPKAPEPNRQNARYKITQMDETQLAASKLDDFEFMEILGTGTFGKVRLCKHKQTKKHFCMKILNKARIHRLKQTEHIHNEKNVLKQLNHPFIVRLYNSFKDSKSLYLLLEFIPGGELFNYIRRSGKLSSEVSRLYAAEIILALEHLHNKRILYRDLKPENILIDETGHVKLTDFGFSKHVPTDRTMSMCGTPEYIAPEIIHNNGHGKAVDWWSLGILIFEMLAGYPPFSDEPNKTIFEKIPTEKVEFPEPFDAEARDLIEKLLVVDPNRRLGCKPGGPGAEEIKGHPWFRNVDWIGIMSKQVPGAVNPGITKDGDTHNFYKYSDVNLNEDLSTDDKTNLDEIFADF